MKPNPKVKTVRDQDYLDFISDQSCVICGDIAEAHHEPLNGRGMGCKGPDDESLPLCRCHHAKRHQRGRETFFGAYGLDWRCLVKSYQDKFNNKAS